MKNFTNHNPAQAELSKLASGRGAEMHKLITQLFPICRSITGDGVRNTLRLLCQHIPLEVREVPSGTQVFDWTVPEEWNITDAYIKNRHGDRIVDFKKSNLHVVNYSRPVNRRMNLAELEPHLFSLPDRPEWIPYRTSYYNDTWGFCLSHRKREQLVDDDYEVCIASELKPGHLTYGELLLPGESKDEILISTHLCHPSLANDNLSGVVAATFLAKQLADVHRRHSFRFLFLPGTIGPIVWLAQNETRALGIKHGLVLASVGAGDKFTYKKSRAGNSLIDRATTHVLRHSGIDHEIHDFTPDGYDERQYGSPGFNLPVGCFMRMAPGTFPEYHTSGDSLEFVQPEFLDQTLSTLLAITDVIESDEIVLNLSPKCEPQLGRRGLYREIGGDANSANEKSMLWVLNLSDGRHTLLDIADQSRTPFEQVKRIAGVLRRHRLVEFRKGIS